MISGLALILSVQMLFQYYRPTTVDAELCLFSALRLRELLCMKATKLPRVYLNDLHARVWFAIVYILVFAMVPDTSRINRFLQTIFTATRKEFS